MKTTVLVCALLALAGCATCRNHPVACGIAGAVVVGSIAASVQHSHDITEARERRTIQPLPLCAPYCAVSQ